MTIGIVTFALASFKQKDRIINTNPQEKLTFKKLSDTIQEDPADTLTVNSLKRQKEDPPVKDRTRW